MSEIKTLLLNSLPTDYDFEDYISAQLLLGGYTLDRSIHEKVAGAGEIFEVDVITHQYNNNDYPNFSFIPTFQSSCCA